MPERTPRKVLPYGSWPTPITSKRVVAEAVRLSEVRVDGEDVIWAEGRPTEAGRTALVRCSRDGQLHELLSPEENARTTVHEYGGGAWWVRDGVVWFASWGDQRLYRRDPRSGHSEPLTPEPDVPTGDRYADGALSPSGESIVCVREHHPAGGRGAIDVRNEIVRLAAHAPSTPEVLVSGPDFVSNPRFGPDGTKLCWIEWDHPNMPWDGSKLLVHDFELDSRELISGGEEESVAEPQWHEDGSLTFISDRTGWWNLYRWTPGGEVEALVELEAEIGVPQWEFGTGRYAVLPDGRIVFARWRDGLDGLAVRLTDGTVADLELPFTFVESIACDRDSSVVVIAGSPQVRPAVVRVRLGEANGIEQVETLRAEPEPSELGIDPAYISIPEPFDFDSAGGRRAHGLLYRPRNPACRAPDGELPPLVVHVHGGPTGCAWPELDLDFQYLTSRGFTVLDLNYGGSTGYGRAYRELLDGNWGVVDVQDSIAAAQALAKTGEVDPGRMSISGGSAGGYTTLACLARAQTPFAAGADYFGIADLEAMTQETHKFESRYLDRLVAPYPEQREVYVQRSPIHHIAEFSTPLIVLQGLEDEVVPPNQATMIVEALRGKGVPVAYMAFEGEQHGFRLEANIRRALDSELSFYAQVFGFELPADEGIEPVAIERPEASAAESNSPR